MKHICLVTFAIALANSATAYADQVFTDDVIVSERLCAGRGCVNNEPFGSEDFRVKDTSPDLLFVDTTSGNSDWRFDVNTSVSDFFSISDQTANTTPFTLTGAAPDNSLFVSGLGNVGLGTSIPQGSLHIQRGGVVNVILESTSNSANWNINAGFSGLFFTDQTGAGNSMILRNGAPSNSIYVEDTGNIGFGTSSPAGKLHTAGSGVQIAYFESTNGGPVQVRFRSDSQNRRFLAVNNANEVQSQVIFLNNQVRITGPTDSGANLYAIIGPAGIATQGPVCDPGPCDKVFDPSEFTVPTIEDHAAYMWENQHLWAVGPTSPDEPFNLTQKAGGMLHELEVAHIYIEQLHERISELEADKRRTGDLAAQVLALTERLDGLEGK